MLFEFFQWPSGGNQPGCCHSYGILWNAMDPGAALGWFFLQVSLCADHSAAAERKFFLMKHTD